MTQIVRYGRLLKADVRDLRVRATINWNTTGSALAGTMRISCARVETAVELASDSTDDLIARVLRTARLGCPAEAAFSGSVPVGCSVMLNGHTLGDQDDGG